MAAVSITAANVIKAASAQSSSGIAGETITAGMPVYLDTTTNKYKKAGDASATLANCAGIALNNASLDQPVDFCTYGSLTLGTDTVTKGTPYFLGDTAGQIVLHGDLGSGDYVTFLGISPSTSAIFVTRLVSGVAIT